MYVDAACVALAAIMLLEFELLVLEVEVTDDDDGLTCANSRLKSFNVVGRIGPNRSEAKLCLVRLLLLLLANDGDVGKLQPLVHDRRFSDPVASTFSSIAVVERGDDNSLLWLSTGLKGDRGPDGDELLH